MDHDGKKGEMIFMDKDICKNIDKYGMFKVDICVFWVDVSECWQEYLVN